MPLNNTDVFNVIFTDEAKDTLRQQVGKLSRDGVQRNS